MEKGKIDVISSKDIIRRAENMPELYPYLQGIVQADVDNLYAKYKEYGDSWKRRGGIGAFMMLCRKWDRLEAIVCRKIYGYDIFKVLATDTRNEGIIDDIRDLRAYLLLVEAEMMASKVIGERK